MSLGYPGSLHAHSDYSNLRLRDCIIKPKDLIDYAIELGHEVVGFTDHEDISGAIEIERCYEKVKEKHPNFKVIRGNEIYLCRNGLSQENFIKGEDKFYHFILLAKDAKGHKQLREISTRAWLRSWMAQKIRRVPTYYSDLQEIIGADPGHIIGSTACFLPGQKVKTLKGEKNIEDITNEDYILNSQGQWEKINYPTNRKYEGLGNILEITKEPTKIKCTANHQFLTYNYKTEQLKWVEAQDLQKQDWVLEPIIPISYSNNEILNIEEFKSIIDYRQKSQGQNYLTNIYRLPNRITLTNEVMRLFGLWLADGHISKHEEYHKNNIGFTFSSQEFDVFYNSFVKKGLNDLGLKEQDYTISKRPENNRVDLNINKVEFCLMFYELFGISHANNKYIPDRLKHINKDFDIELFFGYFLGDGYFRYRKSQGGEIVAASISSQLIKDFEQLSNSFNLSGSITISKSHKGKDGANHQESYYLTYSNAVLGREFSKEKAITHEKLLEIITLASNKKKCYAEFINIKGIKYRVKKIKSNTTFNINEKVYCLNTDSHNFVLNNVIVHNCLGGRLPELILQKADDNYIHQWIYNMKKIFGEEDFYLEMQPSENVEQITVNKKLYELAIETNTKFIITTDAHYLKKSDAPVHKAYLRSQNGEREVDSFYASTYMMDTEELEKYFPYFSKEKLQEGYEAIIEIKNKCKDYSLLKPLKIPELKRKEYADYSRIAPRYYNKMPSLRLFVESAHSGDKVLANAVIDKLQKKPEEFDNKETYNALEICLKSTWESSLVNETRWSDYYLNLQKIIDTCWEAGSLVGPGRGSGTGFLLLYILDIIQINHLKENVPMFPWRFLNPRRVSPLDVDFDIEGARRNQVLAKFREVYGEDRVANVITFGTEKSKSSIITAARGLGMEVEDAQYIASLVPSDRGTPRTLEQCYCGDKENNLEPVALFVKEMKNHPQLWEVAQKIQGLKCRCGIHAGGIIFVDEPFTESTALMRAPDGTIVTAFELHDSEAVGLIKYDALSVEAMDKMHACLDLLIEAGKIKPEATLKETYEKVIGVYTLEREDKHMWEMIWKHQILSLFQFEAQSGIQAIELSKPDNLGDLATLNATIRLMAQEKGAEQPLNKFARFKKDISLWYKEMDEYGLTKEEQKILEPLLLSSSGLCIAQEQFMQLVQLPECGGFDLGWADRLRKAIAKKAPKDYEQLTKEYYENCERKGLSYRLCDYVWSVLIAMNRGYGFNYAHTGAYSIVALQEMNLAYKYPTIYWSCACLINDSGSLEDNSEEEIVDIYEPEADDFANGVTFIDLPNKKQKIRKTSSTDYAKLARAINKIKDAGIEIKPVSINNSGFSFRPDEENNTIFFGMKGLLNVSDDLVKQIIDNRPYSSIKDFYYRISPKRQSMVSLVKSGAFDEFINDRKFNMAWYLWEACDKKKRITLQNMGGLIKYNLLPTETEEFQKAKRIYEFNRYLKAVCKTNSQTYQLDDRAINFLTEFDYTDLIEGNILNAKIWDKKYQEWMNIFRSWITENKDKILQDLNNCIFKEDWIKYASGSISAWEMEVMCFYYHEHELKNVNNEKYGFNDFFKLPSEPEVERSFRKGNKIINLYKLGKLCGTCIAKDNNKSTITLLTTTGVVTVKFNKQYYSMFNKVLFEKNPDGTKTTVEKSWFNRGSKLIIQGMRSGEAFIAKKYASTGTHTMYKITEVLPNGDIIVQDERAGINDE